MGHIFWKFIEKNGLRKILDRLCSSEIQCQAILRNEVDRSPSLSQGSLRRTPRIVSGNRFGSCLNWVKSIFYSLSKNRQSVTYNNLKVFVSTRTLIVRAINQFRRQCLKINYIGLSSTTEHSINFRKRYSQNNSIQCSVSHLYLIRSSLIPKINWHFVLNHHAVGTYKVCLQVMKYLLPDNKYAITYLFRQFRG